MLGILKLPAPGTSGEQSTYPAPFPSVSVQAQKTRDLLSAHVEVVNLCLLGLVTYQSSVVSPQEHR